MPQRYQKKRRPFTSQEDDLLRKLKADGDSYTDIADRMDRSRNSIIGRWNNKLNKKKILHDD